MRRPSRKSKEPIPADAVGTVVLRLTWALLPRVPFDSWTVREASGASAPGRERSPLPVERRRTRQPRTVRTRLSQKRVPPRVSLRGWSWKKAKRSLRNGEYAETFLHGRSPSSLSTVQEIAATSLSDRTRRWVRSCRTRHVSRRSNPRGRKRITHQPALGSSCPHVGYSKIVGNHVEYPLLSTLHSISHI